MAGLISAEVEASSADAGLPASAVVVLTASLARYRKLRSLEWQGRRANSASIVELSYAVRLLLAGRCACTLHALRDQPLRLQV